MALLLDCPLLLIYVFNLLLTSVNLHQWAHVAPVAVHEINESSISRCEALSGFVPS